VVCQRKKTVTLRVGPTCRKKETKVVDFAAFAATSHLDALETGLTGRLGTAEHELGLVCPKAPTRTFVPAVVTGNGFRVVEGCRTFDGDPARCNAAYEALQGEPVSCVHYGGACNPCYFNLEDSGACQNACAPVDCPGAPTRTYRGSAHDRLCEAQPTQAECETAFVVNDLSDEIAGFAATLLLERRHVEVRDVHVRRCVRQRLPLAVDKQRPRHPIPRYG